MFSLYQRLKEMDADTFQRLCFQLLKDRHPSAELRHVEGASGDEGLDLFQGILSESPVIWQCKAFPNGVGKSQRDQIRHSLKTAFKNFSPAQWILCLSVDLDAKAHRWFQKLQVSYASKTNIGLFPASDIVHELVHRRALRNVFFPGAVIDVAELKSIMTRTGELTTEELERVTDSNIEEYIERLKDRDARFNYEIVFNGERGAGAGPPEHRSGLILSFGDGSKTVNVFARDVEALRQDPPKMTLTFKDEGIGKINDFIQTGRSQEFGSAELCGMKSNWPLLQPLCEVKKDLKLIIQAPASLKRHRSRARVVFTSKTSVVEYGFIEFSLVRRGAREEEFVSVNNLPFQLSFVVGINTGTCDIGLKPKFIDHEIRSIKKFCEAFEILRAGGRIDAFDLDRESLLFSTETTGFEAAEGFQRCKAFVDDLVAVEDRFDVKLVWPARVTQEDIQWATLLKCCAEGSTLELANIRFNVLKSDENKSSGAELLASSVSYYRAEHQYLSPKPRIFGAEIFTGPCAMTVDRGKIENLTQTIERFSEAAIGEAVEITIIPETPVRFELLANQLLSEKT